MEVKFTEGVKEIISITRNVAIRLGNTFIAPHHLLIAIIEYYSGEDTSKKDDFSAGEIFALSNVNLSTTKLSIENLIKGESSIDKSASIPLTKEAEKILKITYLEARVTKTPEINSAMLLLSILRADVELINKVLDAYQLNYETALSIYLEHVFPKVISSYGKNSNSGVSGNLNLYFDLGEFSSDEIAEIIASLSDLYRSMGGDGLEIKSIENLEYSRVLIPA